jgi:vitamin B12 transporter
VTLRSICIAGLLASLAPPVNAVDLPEIVVTATRTPLSVSQVPAASTIVTREDIERQQAKSLPQILKMVAGVDITESGGAGKATGLFLRGTESDHVLFLVNGIRVGSATAGLTSLELLPVAQIDRIEVIRGPRASQWGSEAIGGVVHIFTRTGATDPGMSADAGAGTFGTYAVNGGVGSHINRTDYRVDGSYFSTRGFDARQPVPGPFGLDQPDDDGYDNASIHARLGHRFENGVEVDGFMWRASGTTEFDGSFQDKTDFLQQVIGGSAVFTPIEHWAFTLRAGENRDNSDNFAPDGTFVSRFDTKRQELSIQNDFIAAKNQLFTLGADLRKEKVAGSADFTETSRDNAGVFAQYLAEVGSHQLLASLRYDDNEVYGTDTNGGLGWSYRWPDGVRIYASYGTAFKAPSFNELFFPAFGNPDLSPETSESYEIGVEGRQNWGEWGVHAYRTDIDDLIVTVSDPVTGVFFPDNVDQARIEGVEAELATDVAGWQVTVVASLLDPKNRITGKRLRRRVKKSLSFEVSRGFGRWMAGARLLAQGDRFEDAQNTIRLAGYGVVDLLGQYRFNRQWSVRAKIGNLFDEQYQTADTFNTAGRNLFVSLHIADR